MAFNKNEFGALVKAYRQQRGWTQEELAERWGHTRGYVSQVEAGRRKVDSAEQFVRLADILEIPQEQLEAIGRGIPERRIKTPTLAQADDAILQMLLAPAREMIKFAWLAWWADSVPNIEERLCDLVAQLDQALSSYRGEFTAHAQQLLAYAHQMLGKIAQDRLDYTAAGAHFSEMITFGLELNDADIVTNGMVHQADVLRKRGRFEASLRCFEAAKPYAEVASPSVKGRRLMIMGRAYASYGDGLNFLRVADESIEIAESIKETLDSLADEFSYCDALQEKAQGHTVLWQPEKALEIYKETDRLRPFRQLRDRSSYAIVKAQAYAYMGDLHKGTEYAIKGLKMATKVKSKRYIDRLEIMHNRLRVTKMGSDRHVKELGEALRETRYKQAEW
ncbi:MAG TPA: helix-turn-helix domain-containing protein [Ktedonobacteraceae bacterium]|nr:helix-turn-helix domain-containing protein [Ktedonobacteraceae bacterium]